MSVFESDIPRDHYYYCLLAIYFELDINHIAAKDRGIIKRCNLKHIQKWNGYTQTEKMIFINRVLYEYYFKVNTGFNTFWNFKETMEKKADEYKGNYSYDKQQNSQQETKYDWEYIWKSMGFNFRQSGDKILDSIQAYRILGLSHGATKSQIKDVYKSLVKLHHPDKGGNQQKFIEIQNAYDTLMKEVG